MKIGVLTFHYMVNIGSVLQAYCVYKLLKHKYPKAQIEIINLVPQKRGNSQKLFFKKKPPFFSLKEYLYYKSYRKFLEANIPLSPYNSSDNLSAQIEFINKQKYDYIFTGSDTVWMDSDKLDHLLPHIYYLPNQIRAKKISIAASVDPLKNNSNFLIKQSQIVEMLNDYETITVRDSTTFSLFRSLGIHNIIKIADPTLLYNFESDLRIPMRKKTPVKKRNVKVYLPDKKIKSNIYNILDKEGGFSYLKDSNKLLKEFLIDDLKENEKIDILITDRFHRSIFAMKLTNALVINIERPNKNPNTDSKGRDLFNSIDMPNYCLRYNEDEEFESDLLTLINNWNFSEFTKREQNLNDMIRLNRKILWEKVLVLL